MPNEPITIKAAIKSTHANMELGERTLTLTIPMSESAKVAQLSIYDQIVFDVQFTPVETRDFPGAEPAV